ncbi:MULTISPECIES: sigma-70 family RNA polymerase sigma factor [unclassified Sphingobacterium]|uniref:sigma-70 family RNA polymerase sigma factor n=1 Tax=unclassified Sphingobacterium TaxID=2609468 RepID=UPI0025F1F295|nr:MULTISPECIES: sigma-70 family RNA polymerase sigma factor [unclassified Sphingobacterium]
MEQFDKIFKNYFIRLCSYARSIIGSEDVAEDMVQEAFIVLSQNQDILNKSEVTIKSFLYSSVKYICLNHVRRRCIGQRVQNENLIYEKLDYSDHLEGLIKAEIFGELHKELSNLPKKCKRICELIFLEEKSYEEAAAELNVSINTIKTQRQRALKYLKSKFLMEFLFLLFAKILWLIYSCL